jgi:penicillin-binding protein 2
MLQVKYKLYEDYYSDEEITALLRVRYEMERVQFGYYNSYTLAKSVPMELVSYIEESGIDGVNFKIRAERVYSYPGYASHILGRVGKIQESELDYYTELGYSMDSLVGNSGCEKAFEGFLHSQDGILSVEYDENGSVVDKHYEVEPISGNDVWLTIDINMQIAAEDSLRETITNMQYSKAGSAVSLEANSGAVLAIASYPTYDLAQFDSVDYYSSLQADAALPLLNRALSGTYAPGSVYKIGAALAALEEGHISESSTYTCDKVFPHLHNPTCLGNHGTTTVVNAIRDSCNVFFYYLGMDMGCDALTKYTKPLGLGVPTGIELYESTGVVGGRATADNWGAGNDLSAAIGQANHAYTPLQMALYTATLTNGGTRYSAHLLHSVHQFYTGKLILSYEKNVTETVEISAQNKNIVLEGMRRVVASSSLISSNFANVPVTVGGKTGTAEVNNKVDYALFTGAAPYNDPEIVGFCVIEEGAVGGYASAPVAKMFEAYYSHK